MTFDKKFEDILEFIFVNFIVYVRQWCI